MFFAEYIVVFAHFLAIVVDKTSAFIVKLDYCQTIAEREYATDLFYGTFSVLCRQSTTISVFAISLFYSMVSL